MTCQNSCKDVSIGFLLGAAVGVAIGILYAPHSGKITRGLIEEKVHEATLRAEKIIDEAREKAENIIKEAKAKLPG